MKHRNTYNVIILLFSKIKIHFVFDLKSHISAEELRRLKKKHSQDTFLLQTYISSRWFLSYIFYDMMKTQPYIKQATTKD